MVTAGGATFLAGGAPRFGGLLSVDTTGPVGLERLSSPELQLEIPKAANSANTSTVKAMRAGVHNGFPLLVLLIGGISYLLTAQAV
jgi:hypothetical protein